MTEIRQLFSDAQPGPKEEDLGRDFVAVARAIASICATRLLLLIAVTTGAVIWGYSVWSPMPDRLYAAIAFSVVFVLPQVALFWKRG